jgi:uncharacterized protein YdhG (YjbR/CyaY superfamily)
MFHLLKAAVNPALNMAECVRNWYSISRQLREATRKRKYQMPRLSTDMAFLS